MTPEHNNRGKENRMRMPDFFRKHGIVGPVLSAVLLVLLVFAAVYGVRLNPLVGKTWDHFDKPKVNAAQVQPGNVLDTTRRGCEITGPDGKQLTITPAKSGVLLIPKGSKVSGECITQPAA